MEEELMELLKKLETQIDGVEAYYRQLSEFSDKPEMRHWNTYNFATRIKTECFAAQHGSIIDMREGLQRIEDQMNLSC